MAKSGEVLQAGLSVESIRLVVLAAVIGIPPSASRLAPHVSETPPRAAGDLEQIKLLLGHALIQTTERHLASEQELAVAVNDSIGAVSGGYEGGSLVHSWKAA